MNAAAAKQLDSYTMEDIYNLPDGQRAELIDGELYMMATPNRIHQKLVMSLSNSIFNYIQDKTVIAKYIQHHFQYF